MMNPNSRSVTPLLPTAMPSQQTQNLFPQGNNQPPDYLHLHHQQYHHHHQQQQMQVSPKLLTAQLNNSNAGLNNNKTKKKTVARMMYDRLYSEPIKHSNSNNGTYNYGNSYDAQNAKGPRTSPKRDFGMLYVVLIIR
jgi:hypothetical protein